MKRRRRTIAATVIVVLVAMVCLAAIGIRYFMKTTQANLERLSSLPMADVDVSLIPDGTYTGSFSMFPVSAEVNVTVKDHRIADVQLVEHRHGRGAAAEIIPDKVVEAQTLEVDTIAGATYSSRVILKAIENALMSVGQ